MAFIAVEIIKKVKKTRDQRDFFIFQFSQRLFWFRHPLISMRF